jgi:hypothetical protein
MPGNFPSVGLDGTLSDGDCVVDLAATVRGLLSARPSDRTLAAQTVEHTGVKHFPRWHVHITVDRLVRDPHRRVIEILPFSHLKCHLNVVNDKKVGKHDAPRSGGQGSMDPAHCAPAMIAGSEEGYRNSGYLAMCSVTMTQPGPAGEHSVT